MALLRLLLAALEPECVCVVAELEVDLKEVGAGQSEAQFLRVAAHLVVVHGQATSENDVVHAVKCCAAKTVMLGQGSQRRGGGVSRDAEDDVEVWINIPLETPFGSVWCDGVVGQIEVAAAGFLVGEQIAAGQAKFGHYSAVQPFVKSVVRMALDGELIVVEERPVLSQSKVWQVDEDADALARLGVEGVAQQPRETERGELWLIHKKGVCLAKVCGAARIEQQMRLKIKPKNRLAKRVEGG